MKIKHTVIDVFVFLSFSCSNNNENSISSMLWIDSERVNCMGVGEQYETGYIYKIIVTKIKVKNPPADGSSVQYKLNSLPLKNNTWLFFI